MDGKAGSSQLLTEAEIRLFLVESYPRLVGAVALASGSRAAAEDAVQEALVRAWERSNRGENIDSLAAWVAKVALNLSRSRLRRLKAERRAGLRLATRRVAGTASSDDLIDLERALFALPRRQREATVLRYYLGLDVAQVATALGVREGTARATLFHARRKLAVALTDRDDEEEGDRVPFG